MFTSKYPLIPSNLAFTVYTHDSECDTTEIKGFPHENNKAGLKFPKKLMQSRLGPIFFSK